MSQYVEEHFSHLHNAKVRTFFVSAKFFLNFFQKILYS